jgi:cellulose synthase operon protein YhjQ
MGSRSTGIDEHSTAESTPEDVAALYSWANLQGAKYRDYSASRREYRAQVRYRAAKALLERELCGQMESEAAAAEAERADGGDEGFATEERGIPAGDEAARVAATDRVDAARRAESLARLALLALREEREIAEAHSSAERQALVYRGAEVRRRQLAGPQPYGLLHEASGVPGADASGGRFDVADDLQQFLFPGWEGFAFSGLAGGLMGGDSDSDRLRSGAGGSADFDWDDGEDDASDDELNTPAWLFSSQAAVRPEAVQGSVRGERAEVPPGDTLLDSRERVAARWFALKGVFDGAGPELAAMEPVQSRGVSLPMLAIFSLAGGTGKTSLAATLARGLALRGEKIVLADTTAQGLLPIYFGLHELRAGAVHEIEAGAEGGTGTLVLAMHSGRGGEDAGRRAALADEIILRGEGQDRMVLDLATGSDWLIRRLVEMHPTVLVPIAPDINSVMSLQAVERLFHGVMDSQRRPLLPVYVLNQFDASLPLHLDIREVFRRRLGDRLARVAIRRSPAVSEALAEGMTALEYAPDDPISQDYLDLVAWVRSISPTATGELSDVRRGEG